MGCPGLHGVSRPMGLPGRATNRGAPGVLGEQLAAADVAPARQEGTPTGARPARRAGRVACASALVRVVVLARRVRLPAESTPTAWRFRCDGQLLAAASRRVGACGSRVVPGV